MQPHLLHMIVYMLYILCPGSAKQSATKAQECVSAAVMMACNGSPTATATDEDHMVIEELSEDVRKKLRFQDAQSRPKDPSTPPSPEPEITETKGMGHNTMHTHESKTAKSEPECTSKSSLAPSVRLRKYLEDVKEKRTMKDTAEEGACSADLLPAKPSDWGQHKPVTANEQEPPKQRGRKPKKVETKEHEAKEPQKRGRKPKKVETEEHEAKETQKRGRNPKKVETEEHEAKEPQKKRSRAKAKATALAEQAKDTANTKRKSKKATKADESYEPLEAEGDVNFDKGAAFDAYAAASAKADAFVLGEQQQINTEKPKKTGKRKNNSTESTQASKKAVSDDTPATASKRKAEGSTACKKAKRSKVNTEATSNGDTVDTTCTEATRCATTPSESTAPPRPRAVKSAETKAKYSRKSCAYKKKLRDMINQGVDEEEAKLAARQVSIPFA